MVAFIPNKMMADDDTPNPNTGNPRLDSLLITLYENNKIPEDSLIDELRANVYILGSSTGIEYGKATKYLYRVLPFEGHLDRTTMVESLCEINYKNPGQIQITPISVRTNANNGYRILRESFQALLPIYTFRRMNERGNNKSYVIPISREGLEKYKFSFELDTFSVEDKVKRYIRFEPKHKHHTLGSGFLLVNDNKFVEAMVFSGRVDFGKVEIFINIGRDEESKKIIPIQSHIRIGYNYAGSKAANNYECYFEYEKINYVHKKDKSKDNLDLTDIYGKEYQEVNLDSIRPIKLLEEEDSILKESPTKNISEPIRKYSFFKRLPERLVSTNGFSANGNDYRIYGPLEPSTFSYDKLNGITLRQRFTFYRHTKNDKVLSLRTDFGYSFKSKDFRYRVLGDWVYNPKRLGTIRFEASNRSSDFPGKFKDAVNALIKDTTGLIKFEDLGIDYYRSYDFRLEHSSEIANGLILYAGIGYNYRATRKPKPIIPIPPEVDFMLKRNYTDFSPFIRISWTPRQYYYFQGKRKEYIASNYPTFTFEITKGLKNVLHSTSNYTRLEFDVLQVLTIKELNKLSFHGGIGGFLNQKGEYFINYNFFSRSLLPSAWEEQIGGKFNLLGDLWYNSSPSYIQFHATYESPFLLLHQIGLISKYVIKERIYSSMLWSAGKNYYSELGYGIGNNYFSLGFFVSFVGLSVQEAGVKFQLEIDSHI